jgi:hypothetical protein
MLANGAKTRIALEHTCESREGLVLDDMLIDYYNYYRELSDLRLNYVRLSEAYASAVKEAMKAYLWLGAHSGTTKRLLDRAREIDKKLKEMDSIIPWRSDGGRGNYKPIL